ncbi:hypothetical protein CEK62_20665 (plasmid) [Alcanivorax sp. N3-2A]|nr:hypothetical protein CEK62_00470 [Alcanivorax sp. N3-2A]ASK36778.1 hypothetical protein CEK62_20665 [Alcanivorax sp. N3-2A]|tara:strand:- start:30931 stop:31551 length:621 start_codon:yes stop_codon:yes gene_type:complete
MNAIARLPRSPLRALCYGLALWLLAATAQAADVSLDQIRERLVEVPIVRADFQQQQHLSLLPAPLTATGHILLVRDRGLVWTVATPFQSRIKLVNGRLYSNGQVGLLPGGEQFARRLMEVLAGDIAALEPHFDIQASKLKNGNWRLAMTPRNANLAQVLSRLLVTGDSSPSFFRLDYPNGDYSITTLTHIEYPEALSAEEERQLAP